MKTLTDAEKRFVRDAFKERAPATFIAHHVWLCRQLKLEPEMEELNSVGKELTDFVLEEET